MALALDASTPIRATTTSGTAATSASFTPPVGALILVCTSATAGSQTATTVTVTNTGGGLSSWTLVGTANKTTTAGSSNGVATMHWAKVNSSVATTVTATQVSGSTPTSVKVYVITGADTTTPIGVNAIGTSTANTLVTTARTTTVANSYFFISCTEWSVPTAAAPTSTDLTIGKDLYTQSTNLGGGSGAKSVASPASTTVTVDCSGTAAAQWNYVVAEILPAGASNTHTEQITTFEDGTSGSWTPTLAGSGTTAVQTADEHDGQYGASANVPAATGDRAGFTQTFTGAQQATVSGWWKVTTEGASSSSNVPFARLFSGSQRLADVYRQNQQTAGAANVWLRVVKAIGGSNYYFIPTGYRLELDTWVYVSFTWGLDGNPYVWIDGTQVLGPANKPADWFAASSIDTAYLGTHEVGNQGAWSADTITLSTNSVAQTINLPLASEGLFSGSGTLTSTQIPKPTASGSFSGSGTLSKAVTVAFSQSGALSGSGTLAQSTIANPIVSAPFSSEGTLEIDQDGVTMGKAVAFSGSGTLTKAVIARFSASMSSSSTGTLTTATNTMSAQASFLGSGSGTLTSARTPAVSKTVPFSSTGTLSAAVTPSVTVTANLSGVGDLTAASSNSFTRTGNLSGSGTLAGVITGMSLAASAALSGSGTLFGGTVNNKSVSVNLSGSGAFSPFLTAVGFTKSATFAGSGTLSGTSFVTRLASPQFSGSGTLTRNVVPDIQYVFVGASSGSLTAEVRASVAVTAQLSGVGTLVGDPADQLNYEVDAYLAEKRWSGGLGSQRWKGSL